METYHEGDDGTFRVTDGLVYLWDVGIEDWRYVGKELQEGESPTNNLWNDAHETALSIQKITAEAYATKEKWEPKFPYDKKDFKRDIDLKKMAKAIEKTRASYPWTLARAWEGEETLEYLKTLNKIPAPKPISSEIAALQTNVDLEQYRKHKAEPEAQYAEEVAKNIEELANVFFKSLPPCWEIAGAKKIIQSENDLADFHANTMSYKFTLNTDPKFSVGDIALFAGCPMIVGNVVVKDGKWFVEGLLNTFPETAEEDDGLEEDDYENFISKMGDSKPDQECFEVPALDLSNVISIRLEDDGYVTFQFVDKCPIESGVNFKHNDTIYEVISIGHDTSFYEQRYTVTARKYEPKFKITSVQHAGINQGQPIYFDAAIPMDKDTTFSGITGKMYINGVECKSGETVTISKGTNVRLNVASVYGINSYDDGSVLVDKCAHDWRPSKAGKKWCAKCGVYE